MSDLPDCAVKRTGWWRIYNDDHSTWYYITNWSGTTATWKDDALIGTADISSVTSNTLTVAQSSFPVMAYPHRTNGLSFVNEAADKFFRGGYKTTIVRTSGDAVATEDFTDEDGDEWKEARIYDFGNDDVIETPAEAAISKVGDSYYVSANVALSYTIDGHSGSLTSDQLTGDTQLLPMRRVTITTARGGTMIGNQP